MEEAIDNLAMIIEDELVARISDLTKEIVELQGIIENLAASVSKLTEMMS